jgi:hypothetical protein
MPPTTPAAPQALSGFTSRFETEARKSFPQLDPAITTTLIDFLMGLVTGCTQQPTPEEAVARVKALGPFQQSALRARFARRVRADKIKNPDANATAAINAVVSVARASTPQEQIDFAASLLPFQDPDNFDIF